MGAFRFVRILALGLDIVPLISLVPVFGSHFGENRLVICCDSAQARMVVWQSPRGHNSVGIVLNDVRALSDQPIWLRGTSSVRHPNVIFQQGAGHFLEITITGRNRQIAVAQTGFATMATITSWASRTRRRCNNMVGVAMLLSVKLALET